MSTKYQVGDEFLESGSGRTLKITHIAIEYPTINSVKITYTLNTVGLYPYVFVYEEPPLEVLIQNGHLIRSMSLRAAINSPFQTQYFASLSRDGSGSVIDNQVKLIDRHEGHEVIENMALNKRFKYCRDCKKEVA